MPELPEVETTRRGLAPHVAGRRVQELIVRQPHLRWPIPASAEGITGQTVSALERRGKWLLFRTRPGTLLLHLGMSGSLRVLATAPSPKAHDHVDLVLDSGALVRFTDPRRFGAILWQPGNPLTHPMLARLGPEPLSDDFTGDYLWRRSRKRRTPVKNFIMDGSIVVGVGNIYAAEALFAAGIHPLRGAGRVSRERYGILASCIREVLQRAILAGGTTLRDFTVADGSPGYFAQELQVYGRDGQACRICGGLLKHRTIGQRSTVYCPVCQR